MTNSELLNSGGLKDYPIFEGMSDNQILEIQKSIRPGNYKKGEFIWKEDDSGRDVLLLMEGTIQISQSLTLFPSEADEGEYDKSIVLLKAEDRPIIGEIALCTNTPRSASLKAITDVKTGLLTIQDIDEVVKGDPFFGVLFYRNLANIIGERLITANKNVLKLTTAFSLALRHGA